MHIGIGITTYNRPECLAECKAQIAKHTNMDNVFIYVAEDTDQDRQGVAYRKNECLRALKDCDYIFLFDDDCYPIKDNWIEFFVNSGQKHLLYLDNKFHRINYLQKDLRVYKDCGGVFMYVTKDAIDEVGAFNEKFEKWGMEHAEWSIRILKKGDEYPCLFDTYEYIYSHDYSNPKHKSSITNEEKELLFKKNFPKFITGIDNIYIPL